MARRQSIGSTCSRASLRRRSLATLQWLAENDPQRLAQKLQALYSDQSGALAPHKEEEKLDDEEEAEHLTDDDEPSSEDPLGRLSLADVTQKSGSHVTANASGSAITSNDPQTRSRGYSSPQMPHAGRASLDQNRSLQVRFADHSAGKKKLTMYVASCQAYQSARFGGIIAR